MCHNFDGNITLEAQPHVILVMMRVDSLLDIDSVLTIAINYNEIIPSRDFIAQTILQQRFHYGTKNPKPKHNPVCTSNFSPVASKHKTQAT